MMLRIKKITLQSKRPIFLFNMPIWRRRQEIFEIDYTLKNKKRNCQRRS